ncbi:MAG: C1 family peptidase [Acidobacteria bacterium]|nr:C1 family peptidase [Acidobacteriota bacterium]
MRKDPIDLRDRMYEPPLIDLPARLDNRKRVPKVLDQGKEGSCTGFGLAALVNYWHANRRAKSGSSALVSPHMLYALAKRYDEWPGEKYEGSSIRGGMKGWLRHGVCSSKLWSASKKDTEITAGIMKDALQRPLGAYYRVRHLHLNHMHAALNETGILYASGDVHAGWDNTDSKGRIPWTDEKTGGHAYATSATTSTASGSRIRGTPIGASVASPTCPTTTGSRTATTVGSRARACRPIRSRSTVLRGAIASRPSTTSRTKRW